MNQILTQMVLSRFHASLSNNINQRLTAELAAGLIVALEEALKGAVLVPPPAAPADSPPAPLGALEEALKGAVLVPPPAAPADPTPAPN